MLHEPAKFQSEERFEHRVRRDFSSADDNVDVHGLRTESGEDPTLSRSQVHIGNASLQATRLATGIAREFVQNIGDRRDELGPLLDQSMRSQSDRTAAP